MKRLTFQAKRKSAGVRSAQPSTMASVGRR
jgi:hypothetical protein